MSQIEEPGRAGRLLNEIITLDARITAAQHMRLTRLRELRSCLVLVDCTFAQFIAWRCHVDMKTAYEWIRVADALETLPLIDGLFAEGRLTYSKVRIITRVATPETDRPYSEHGLLLTVRHLERFVKLHRSVLPDEAAKQNNARYLRFREAADGSFIMSAKLTAEQGVVVKRALELALTVSAGEDIGQCNADALDRLARAAIPQLATGEATVLKVRSDQSLRVEKDGEVQPAAASSTAGTTSAATGCCSVDGHAVAPHIAERLLCEGSVSRRATTRQVARLREIHYGECAHPRCTYKSFLESHHIVLWSKGGRTRLENLTLLCSKHHKMLHAGHFTVQRDARGELEFKDAYGYRIASSPPAPCTARTDRSLETSVPRTTRIDGRDIWWGDKPDYNLSVAIMQANQG